MNGPKPALPGGIAAILFDLDDTLLTTRLDTFLPGYIQALARHVASVVDPGKLVECLMKATRIMSARHDPTLTNQQVFDRNFFPDIGVPAETLTPVFEDFYLNTFPALQALTTPRPAARSVVQAAFARVTDVVIATQPVFPLTAIRQRLAWAGVDDFPYRLVTAYENMHTCKPDPAYYQEIAARVGVPATECLMVGNDLDQDIAPAASAGMFTYHILPDGESEPAVRSGDLTRLLRWLTTA